MEYSDWTIILLIAVGIVIFYITRRGENVLIPQGDMHSSMESFGMQISEAERESYIEQNIQSIADEQFPDDEGEQWTIHGYSHQNAVTFVELEPETDDVGYDEFVFAISFKEPSKPDVLATYRLEDDEFLLLSTKHLFSDDFPQKLSRW